MTVLFTARNTYGPTYEDGASWKKYITWSKLAHLKELVSLDSILSDLVFDVNYESEEIYKYMIVDEYYATNLFNSLDYVLLNVEGKSNFNLLAVVKNPEQECNDIQLEDFEFLGYDLLDIEYEVSALTNCGGFDETFSPKDLNEIGLIDEHSKAFDIRKRLFENNPEEHHADCNVFALWRHRTIGRVIT